jgi:AraC-like DNA-binding protein
MDRLEKIMHQDRPYLNPRFSMHDLCELMDVSRRKVTYVINEVMRKNFYGVINDYRIEEALSLLNDRKSADYKMDAIAEMVGFRSKSSFYACFKKYTGVTPTEFRMKKGQ